MKIRSTERGSFFKPAQVVIVAAILGDAVFVLRKLSAGLLRASGRDV